MKSPYPFQYRFAGILLCLLGAFILSGGVLGSEVMIRVVPGSPAVAVNTALMFLLSGFCLLAVEKEGFARCLYLVSAGLLIVLPLAILGQHILNFNFSIDFADIFTAQGDEHVRPVQTAPNAAVGFLCAGLIFFFNRDRHRGLRYRHMSLFLAGLTLTLGLLALLGYILHLEAMYQLATYNRMATLTAIGLSILGIGTWSLANNIGSTFTDTAVNQAHRIVRLSATLLTVFAVTAGLTGFAILRHGFEESSRNNLLSAAKTSAFIISSEIDKGLLISKSIANRVSLREHLLNLDSNYKDEKTIRELHAAGETLIESGFLRIHIISPADEHIATIGNAAATQTTIGVPLNSEIMASLLWQDGFVLKHEQDVIRDGKLLGTIVTEWPLRELTELVIETQTIGKSDDLVLCGYADNKVVCFPSRFNKNPVALDALAENRHTAYPVVKALAGETGAIATADLRDIVVQAGYAPIPDYRLGLMVKKDVVELYAALRDRLNLLIASLLLFVGVGTLLIRNWVRPLVEQIVTEQRRIEAILNNSNDAFIAVDSQGLISDWNLQAEKTLGWRKDEAIREDLATLLIPHNQRQAHNRIFERFLTTKTGQVASRRTETSVIHKDGYEIPVELSIASFHNGKDFGASIFMRDLTDIKVAELQAAKHTKELEAARAALVQSQKLEAVGKLTGGVAHDFNNVLQVVQGSLQLLQLENTHNAISARRVNTAIAAVDRGAKLSAQLLAFARKQPLQPKVKNLAGIIHGMSDMLRRVLGDAIEIEVITSDNPWNTLIDPNQLENVILNLAINARDAMKSAGKLTIEVSNCVLNEDYVRAEPGLAAGDFVMLSISDTGPGIPEDLLDRVFEPFFTTKPEGEGTGLGLSMVHGFVKQSEGHIRIFSETGQGTTLRIYLPRSFEQPVKESAPMIDKADGGYETILVVEDDLAVQATVVDTLMGLGYKVLKADNAEDALRLIKKNKKIDLLFTDVVMPGALRSPELARQAKKLIPNLQVLFTSGYTRSAIESGGRLDQGVHLLSKPYGRDRLARKLRELLEKTTAMQAESSATSATDWAGKQDIRIAFVEDNEDCRIAVSKMLELMGYRVASFDNSEAALEHLQHEKFDVLITDVSLPGMSGIELSEKVHEAWEDIKIIFASGYSDAIGDKLKFKFQLLPKPFTIDQLLKCLDAH